MELNILTVCYLLGAITFILGLKMLSNPATARRGNQIAATGMIVAEANSAFLLQLSDFALAAVYASPSDEAVDPVSRENR